MEGPPVVSTGLADNPVHAYVGSVKSILASVDENDPVKWLLMIKMQVLLVSAYHLKPTPTKPTTCNLQ